MRLLLLVAAISFTACDSDGTPFPDFGVTTVDMAVPVFSCAGNCSPACTAGSTCVGMGSSVNPFAATCLVPCTSDVDCPDQRACVAIGGGTTPDGRFCLDRMEPLACGTHCDFAERVSLCSGNELAGTFHNSVVCGVSYHHCANGCVEDAPDGGTERQARCQ
jgi:hypothetical protein